MNVRTYQLIMSIKNYYDYEIFDGKISMNDLFKIFNVSNKEDLKISEEDILFAEEYLKSEDKDSLLFDEFSQDFQRMSKEEILENLESFVENGYCNKVLFAAIPDINILLDALENIDINKQPTVLRFISKQQMFQYINEDRKSSDLLLKYLSSIQNSKFKKEIMDSIASDYKRAKILIYGANDEFLPYIKDKFYRTQIVKLTSEFNFDKNILLSEIEEYNSYLATLETMSTEEEKANFICNIDNQDIKYSLLDQCTKRECRNLVVSSFTGNIDPEITSLNQLAQTMILEYFKDTLGEKLTDEKMERLKIAFNRTNISFEKIENNVNGIVNYIFRSISISNRHKTSNSRNLGFIIHEYEHILSLSDYADTKNSPTYSIEEGMADTFADLVINHYIEKYNKIELDGRTIRTDIPYVTYSGYNFENGWVRTMLAGLETSGKDVEAVGEYVLGDKTMFLEMTLGKDTAKGKDVTSFGMPLIETNRCEIFFSPTQDFSSINENSIYYNRNYILPLFKLQNNLDNNVDLVGVLSRGKSYHANYVAQQYFEGRKFYEISNNELDNFIRLLYGQITPKDSSAIIGILDYCNNEINNLDSETTQKYSLEILSNIPVLFGKELNLKAGNNLENILRIVFETEIEKMRSGKPYEIDKQRFESIIQLYTSLFQEKTESNMYIMDYVHDFEFEYQRLETQGQINPLTSISSALETISTEDINSANENLFFQGEQIYEPK